MVQVQLKLTAPQMKKVHAGKAIQLSHANLINPTGEHTFEFDTNKAFHNKLQRSAIQGKGIRLPKDLVKNASATARNVATSVLDEGERLLPSKKRVTKAADNLLQKVNLQRIPRAKKVAMMNEDEPENPNFEGEGIKSDFKKFGRTLKRAFKPAVPVLKQVGKVAVPILKNVAKATVPILASAAGTAAGAYFGPSGALLGSELGRAGGTAAVSGLGVRPAKGSQEAKDRMAKLRAMRKSKGSGLLGSIGKTVLKTAVPIVTKRATEMAIDSMTGEGLVDRRHRKVKMPIATARSLKIKNPRVKIPFSTLNDGIPQVNSSGNGFSGWAYA